MALEWPDINSQVAREEEARRPDAIAECCILRYHSQLSTQEVHHTPRQKKQAKLSVSPAHNNRGKKYLHAWSLHKKSALVEALRSRAKVRGDVLLADGVGRCRQREVPHRDCTTT